jgi:hypothetical protein
MADRVDEVGALQVFFHLKVFVASALVIDDKVIPNVQSSR